MNLQKRICSAFSKEIVTFLLLTLSSLFVFARYVKVVPRLDENFFFSSDDPQFQDEKRIGRHFKRKDTQVIISVEGNIKSPGYAKQIGMLTATVQSLENISNVLSITSGPNNISDALYSPFWKRILISEDYKASNIIVILDERHASSSIAPIENIVGEAKSRGLTVRLSGIPYIVKTIEKNLIHDFKIFSIFAFIMFGCVFFFIFRSWLILTATLVCCLSSGIWTLMLVDLFNIQIGLLTANLFTIVFVLTLSPIVFLTYNWKQFRTASPEIDSVRETIRYTLTPSLWSMFTTLLGFLSLLGVQAKPLRELGLCGSIGTLVAFVTAYTIYPAFLKCASSLKTSKDPFEHTEDMLYEKLAKSKKRIVIALVCLGIISVPGLWMMNHDPSLLSYFKRDGEIFRGLSYIDRNGGSSPLIIVVSVQSGEKLNTTKAYKQLWQLQTSLEKHEAVGTILSLPILMAQAKRSPLAFILTWDWIFDIMESRRFDEIAKSFISEDRSSGLFLLRMKEQGRQQTRLRIVEELLEVVKKNGFKTETVGGIYNLSGHMSQLIASSLIYGLANLIFLFFIIGLIASRSLRVSAAMTVSISAIPIVVLGIIGYTKTPLDVISAPAVNVAISMGIDSMLHMIKFWRYSKRDGYQGNDWEKVRKRLWNPTSNATLLIMLGFGIFLFSQFPPTQRFGSAIVYGTLLNACVALFVFPWLVETHFISLVRKKIFKTRTCIMPKMGKITVAIIKMGKMNKGILFINFPFLYPVRSKSPKAIAAPLVRTSNGV